MSVTHLDVNQNGCAKSLVKGNVLRNSVPMARQNSYTQFPWHKGTYREGKCTSEKSLQSQQGFPWAPALLLPNRSVLHRCMWTNYMEELHKSAKILQQIASVQIKSLIFKHPQMSLASSVTSREPLVAWAWPRASQSGSVSMDCVSLFSSALFKCCIDDPRPSDFSQTCLQCCEQGLHLFLSLWCRWCAAFLGLCPRTAWMTLIVAAIKPGLFAQQLLGALFLCEKNAAGLPMAWTRYMPPPNAPCKAVFLIQHLSKWQTVLFNHQDLIPKSAQPLLKEGARHGRTLTTLPARKWL